MSIEDGSIGENILLSGPAFEAGKDLKVGTRLRLGEKATLQVTEANNPCYRLGYTSWAKHAQAKFGEKWWEHHALPLSLQHHPGGRGWLCKVVVEGTVKPGDICEKV